MTTGTHRPVPRWDVVVTVRAAEAYVARFITVYRSLGAARIHIYYDDPGLSFTFPGDDLVQTRCDESYWGGRRPRAVEKRQIYNATRAAQSSTADWVLHVDIDEHLFADGPVAESLADIPDDCGCVTALPVEAVFAARPRTLDEIFATPFFKSTRPGWHACSAFWKDTYGDLAPLSRGGFWGHRVGKSFIRRSRLPDLPGMPIHMPAGDALKRLAPIKSRTMILRHFDALLPLDWISKHLDRVEQRVKAIWAGDHRNAQSQQVADALQRSGETGAFALYDRMFVVPPDLVARGIALGTITQVPPDAHP